MADLDQILQIVQQIRDDLPSLIQHSQIQPLQIAIGEGLSDITKRLGLIQAGEFRAGNGIEPGLGFSGVRYGYPAFSYAGSLWNIAGVNNDVIQFGLDAATGKAIAGAGAVTLDALGITLEVGNDSTNLNSAIKWVSGSTEYFRMIGWVDTAIHTNQLFIHAHRITGNHAQMQIDVDSVVETISGTPSYSNLSLVAAKGGVSYASINMTAISSTDSTIDMQSVFLNLGGTTTKLGFFGVAPAVVKQTITGSRAGNAALASLLTALALHGLITNSTTA